MHGGRREKVTLFLSRFSSGISDELMSYGLRPAFPPDSGKAGKAASHRIDSLQEAPEVSSFLKAEGGGLAGRESFRD